MITIKEPIENQLEIEKSKFITYLFPCTTPLEAKQHIADIKKQHPKATHWCYAYRIGEIQHSHDDGEPASTAGLPILQTLQGHQLDQVIAIVVRYFGGVLLGKGGLIRAYSHSTSQAISKAILYKEIDLLEVHITVEFNQLNLIETALAKQGQIINRYYDTQAHYRLILENQTHLQALQELTLNRLMIHEIKPIKQLAPIQDK